MFSYTHRFLAFLLQSVLVSWLDACSPYHLPEGQLQNRKTDAKPPPCPLSPCVGLFVKLPLLLRFCSDKTAHVMSLLHMVYLGNAT